MKTLSEVQADRVAAGAAYVAAAQAYIDAWVELHAHDLALSSRTNDNSGFGPLQWPGGHAKFLRDPLHGDAHERARARSVEIGNSLEA
jgi:hypothetical protein